MKNKWYFLLLSAWMMMQCQNKSNTSHVDYPAIPVTVPKTDTVAVSDNYHGTTILDKYRWLEDDTSSQTGAWVKQQNEVTFGYLSKIPFRDDIKKRYAELYNFPKVSGPMLLGDQIIFQKNDGLQNQSVYYIQKGLDGKPEVLIDPNTLSDKGTASISMIGASEDNKYIAYSRQDAGSDWADVYVMNLETRKNLPDVLKWVKFSSAEWQGNGFYYSRYPAPKGGKYSAANAYHSVYYHKLGEPQSKDKLIMRNDKEPQRYHNVSITEDRKYLILYATTGTDGYETYFKDLSKPDAPFVPIYQGFDHKNAIIDHAQGEFIMMTDVDAPNYRVVKVDPANPDVKHWKTFIPQKENLLVGMTSAGGKYFTEYLVNATSRMYVYDGPGGEPKEVQLNGLGSVAGFSGKDSDKMTFYSFTSFVDPGTLYKYDLATGKSEIFFRPELKFNPEDFEQKQVFYKSKDGTSVSMFIVHKKGLEKNGKNPCYLYGYGGFNVNMTPAFSTSRIILLENNGVFAMPNLRGGGEYGEDWHKGGMHEKKQNVFDDFISAVEFLISEGYSSKEKLGIAGGSNGGLLVGACMTQRPDLYAVALPAVGVMDMLRYHKFTVGWGWVPEYGSADSVEAFKYLFAYSPLHNLKKGVAYPATMVTTADHDDRVVPAHSFKFAARLQECHTGPKPALIRIETEAGHGAGKPTSKIIEEQADIWSFFFYNTNSPVRYGEKVKN